MWAGVGFCFRLGRTRTLARPCCRRGNIGVVHLYHYPGVSLSDVTVNVCEPGDLGGDLSLEIRIVQVDFAFLL